MSIYDVNVEPAEDFQTSEDQQNRLYSPEPDPEMSEISDIDDDRTHRGQVRIAYRLADSHARRLMYVYGIGWHYWTGTRWAEDDQGRAGRAVLQVLKTALTDAVRMTETSSRDKLIADVRKCETAPGIGGVLKVAESLAPFSFTVADLDADPYLLNTASGTLDLRSYELRTHDPNDRCTKETSGAYRPDAHSTEWETFLTRVLPDPDVRGYLQRVAGLSLLGKVVEHIFTIALGTGANGKGTTYTALVHAMGDYAHVAESDLFMQAKTSPNAASPALMSLLGKRLIVASETEQDRRLAVALMKNLTGGDPITARPLYGKPVTFNPSHTSLMVTNHLPKVPGDDPAAWRRIRVVPFDVVIPEAEWDGHLGERLELAADAILSWAIEGYRQYDQQGLDAPEAVKIATGEYQKKSDAVARFIDECCYLSPHAYATTGDLHKRWAAWAIEDGAEPMNAKRFGEALDLHGYATRGGTGRDRYSRFGLGLLADDETEPF